MYLCYVYLQMCAYIHKHMCKCNNLYKLLLLLLLLSRFSRVRLCAIP